MYCTFTHAFQTIQHVLLKTAFPCDYYINVCGAYEIIIACTLPLPHSLVPIHMARLTEVYWGEHLVVCILSVGSVVCWSIQFKLLLNFHNILLTTRALLYPATGVYRPFKAPLGMATIIVQKKGSTQFKVASRLHLLCKCHLKRERKKSYIYTS